MYVVVFVFTSKVCADPQKGSHRKVNSASQPRLDQICRALENAARVNTIFAFLRCKQNATIGIIGNAARYSVPTAAKAWENLAHSRRSPRATSAGLGEVSTSVADDYTIGSRSDRYLRAIRGRRDSSVSFSGRIEFNGAVSSLVLVGAPVHLLL